MEDRIPFDINESLKYYLSDPASVPTPDADPELLDCENDPDQLPTALIDNVLNPIVDAVAESPEGLARSSFFDSLQFLLKYTSLFPTRSLSKLLDLVVSGLSVEADIIHGDLESDEQDSIHNHKQLLEMYGFLLQWALSAVEVKAAEKPAEPVPARRGLGKSARSKANAKDGNWDWTAQIQISMETMCKVMKLKLSRIFLTTSDRDTFISLFTRSIYLILESEQRVKSMSIRMHAFKVLCIAVKHHGHAFGAQTSIVQSLTYFEHLSEPMAEFLHILAEQYDYPQLSDEILKELGNKEFNSNDTRGPKSVSTFIVKLSELAPRLIIKQMTLLAKQLDSESYTLRCAVIEVFGNLISDLSRQEERSDNYKTQINAFFDVLEERFLDINPYCRCRAIQVYMRICDLEQKFPKRRQAVAELAARSLEDKSSNVRRNAIRLLAKLVSTHPFSVMHGGQLSHKEWTARLDAVDAELNALRPPETPGFDGAEASHVDSALLDDATQMPEESPSKSLGLTEEERAVAIKKAAEQAATSELLARLQLTRKYYNEAIRFIEVLQSSSGLVAQLLSSRNKSEVIEAMDFFVVLDVYKVETSRSGIRRMLRLIWTKGNSDEGKGVQTHLIDCYKGLFFEAPDSFSPNDAANYIARNMISLTFGSTPAELTCLEQLLSTMMRAGHISDAVIAKLWQVYGVQKKEISRTQRRGAIIVLGMLALADPEVVIKEIETMLRIGLGSLGRSDLLLAKYTCIALRRMVPGRQAKSKDVGIPKLTNDHAVLTKLAAIVETVSDSKEWYGVAEQAIGAIYALSKHPDVLCSDLLKRKTRSVFQPQTQWSSSKVAGEGERSGTAATDDQEASQRTSSTALSRLLFVVGHIAIKQIVHLELCELDFKRRKAEQEKNKAATASAQKNNDAAEDDELDLIGGTTEDDFQDAMAHIRERELLYGKNSLLSNFGPLVMEICANSNIYADRNLQAAATLCMAKLMCVSADYCEKNLPLLITIMERSEDPTVRSNAVIALGDMAVCFNHLIDENTDFLYRRLNDNDASVKRTCLMTLTFLILAGQVKVKGQLGEMAKCLEDEDKRIADLARMFFTELASKDNAVYNHFVDMFSLLSAERNLEEASLRRIVKFLIGFVEKEKHARQLADKLAARLPRCETERQWNDVAYALSLLPHKNEEITKTITAGFNKVVTVNA
ncbi:condensin [Aspergillus sclerotioniger CBS 115572]|uniref:Condensin complex subunit 1 n=1 Tax=Aspergillus sclerotioniger CBS 115572 TaxID=1450535 RepID=A0A317UZH4_9EURO|nr:condensin [Aspergillus sclerotioniger CBS 115572]PWY65957.1 condensin [Aspergillus sclerotioniger CBS 115572]